MALRSETLAAVPLDQPCADFGCGDGVFSFLHLGGRFDPAFDVFTDVNLSDARNGRPDMFDCATDAYQPTIVSPPSQQIDVGLDLKANMLTKAKLLELYGQLIQHDNNDTLPYSAEQFRTIYCNAAYWVENIEGFLVEVRRVLQPGGKIILQVKLDCLSRYTLDAHRAALGERFLDIIAGDRLNCWPSLTDRLTWERRFGRAGLTIEQATPFITKTHAHIWDIGLRPITPLLVKMANALSPQTRAQIKDEWVGRLLELTEPLCRPDLHLGGHEDEPAEMQYVLAGN
jgi:SAM-dependent methyltransferase